MLTNGTGLLFLLWYITPRSAFDQTATSTTAAGERLQNASLQQVVLN
ncbi:hypothetical protein QIH80_14380 [Bradyrhizobium elkanii]|nr:hypothetical protein QIH80_14380 [Bradyrhizobium elkanii]